MTNNDNNKNSLKAQKDKWSKVNFYSCLTAVIVVFVDVVLFILSEYCNTDNAALWLSLLISIAAIGLVAVIVMIVGWCMVRSIEKKIAMNRSRENSDKNN